MADAVQTQPARQTRTQKYQFVEDVWVDETPSKRELAEKGLEFMAVLAEEVAVDKTGVQPREVPTGRFYVVSSDVPILPGCLTSCIRTGRAQTPEQIRAAEKREAAKNKAAKQTAKR